MSDDAASPLVPITPDIALRLSDVRYVQRFTIPCDALGPGPRVMLTMWNDEVIRFSASKMLPTAPALLGLSP